MTVACHWHFYEAEALASNCCASETCYRKPENIRVMAVVISELRLGNIQRQVLGADLVIAAHDAALEEAPEALNRVRMDRADNILLLAVVDGLVGKFVYKERVTLVLVSGQQGNLIAANDADEGFHIQVVSFAKDAGHNIALALHGSDDGNLCAGAFLVLGVPVVVIATDIGFINFNNAHELAKFFIRQPSANAVAHVPSGFVRAETHLPLNLKGANAFLAGQHQMDNAKPITKVFVRVFEDGAGDVREAICATATAVWAFPVPLHGLQRIDVLRAAARAFHDARRPAVSDQIGVAGFLIGEGLFPLRNGHLLDALGFIGHFQSTISTIGRAYVA
jgi:hypothetical protein